MAHLAVTAVGADRPGIVAAVTGVLTGHGCNIEDSSMSILRGHFAMVLVIVAPDDLGAADLESDLTAATADLDLVVTVRVIGDGVPLSPPGDPWTVAVYGADRPGIVHRITSELAELGVNILDLTTRVLGEEGRPVYAMVLEVTVPAGVEVASVGAALKAAAAELGVECSLHPSEADIL